MTALAQSFGQLLVLRGVGGIGSSMFTVSAMALLLRTAGPEQRGRASGAFQAGFLFGGVTGPAIGGAVTGISIRAPFVVYGVTLVVAGLLAVALPGRASPDRASEGTRVGERSVGRLTAVAATATGGADRPRRAERADTPRPAARRLMTAGRAPRSRTPARRRSPRLAGRRPAQRGLPRGAHGEPVQRLHRVRPADLAGPAVRHRGARTGRRPGRHRVPVRGRHPGGDADPGRPLDRQLRSARARCSWAPPTLTVAMLLLALETGAVGFLLAMAASGLASAFLAPASAAVVGDLTRGLSGGRVVSAYQMVGDLGGILGPLIAGALADAARIPVGVRGRGARRAAHHGVRRRHARDPAPGMTDLQDADTCVRHVHAVVRILQVAT